MVRCGSAFIICTYLTFWLEGLRRQAFELMALRTLPASPSDQDIATLEELNQQLERVGDIIMMSYSS